MNTVYFPSPMQVALAIVVCSRHLREDPIGVATGVWPSRARPLAFAALVELFPGHVQRRVAKWVGYPDPVGASANLRAARLAQWWQDETADSIVRQAIVAMLGVEHERSMFRLRHPEEGTYLAREGVGFVKNEDRAWCGPLDQLMAVLKRYPARARGLDVVEVSL